VCAQEDAKHKTERMAEVSALVPVPVLRARCAACARSLWAAQLSVFASAAAHGIQGLRAPRALDTRAYAHNHNDTQIDADGVNLAAGVADIRC
jgi:hypothetical protein